MEAVVDERVAPDDVLSVLAFEQHVGFAHRPRFVVVVLPVQDRARLGVVLQQMLLSHRQHPPCTAGRIVDRLDNMALAQVALRRQQQADHQPDHFARGEVLSGFLVGLLSAYADKFFEDVAHLHVVNPLQRQITTGESLDDLIQQVPLVHSGDLVSEPESVDDLLDVLREAADVGVEVLSQQVRIVQQPVEIQLRRVVE